METARPLDNTKHTTNGTAATGVSRLVLEASVHFLGSEDLLAVALTNKTYWCFNRLRGLLSQLLQQRLRLLQIARVKPLSGPAVNRS